MYPGWDIHLLYDCSWTSTLVCEQDVVVDDLELHATKRHLATEMKSFSVIFLQFFTIATYKRFWNYIAVYSVQNARVTRERKVHSTGHPLCSAPCLFMDCNYGKAFLCAKFLIHFTLEAFKRAGCTDDTRNVWEGNGTLTCWERYTPNFITLYQHHHWQVALYQLRGGFGILTTGLGCARGTCHEAHSSDNTHVECPRVWCMACRRPGDESGARSPCVVSSPLRSLAGRWSSHHASPNGRWRRCSGCW